MRAPNSVVNGCLGTDIFATDIRETFLNEIIALIPKVPSTSKQQWELAVIATCMRTQGYLFDHEHHSFRGEKLERFRNIIAPNYGVAIYRHRRMCRIRAKLFLRGSSAVAQGTGFAALDD